LKTQPRAADATSPETGPDGDRSFSEGDLSHMDLALDEARAAFRADEVPIGAVVVRDGHVLARAHNRTRRDCDPTAHAELLALREAAAGPGRVQGPEEPRSTGRLEGCTVYTTVEPCFMCSGALVLARVARLVFGTRDPKFGGTRSLGQVLEHPGLNHVVQVDEGLAADAASALMREFFQNKRRAKRPSS